MSIQTNENIKISIENILLPSATTVNTVDFNTISLKITIYDLFMSSTSIWKKYTTEINNLFDTVNGIVVTPNTNTTENLNVSGNTNYFGAPNQ